MPSKRARKIPDKIQVSKEDLSELQNSPETISSEEVSAEVDSEENEVSIDQLKDQEATDTSDNSENQDQ